jgi:hypothetical protein
MQNEETTTGTGVSETHTTTSTVSKPKKATAKPTVKKAAKPAKATKPSKPAVKKAKPAKATKPSKSAKPSKARTADNSNRDFGRVKVAGETFSKGRAVHAATVALMEKKHLTAAQLKDVLPDALVRTYGLVKEVNKAKEYSINGKKRYRLGKDEIIKTKDGKQFAVCTEITAENLPGIIKAFKAEGITLTPAK